MDWHEVPEVAVARAAKLAEAAPAVRGRVSDVAPAVACGVYVCPDTGRTGYRLYGGDEGLLKAALADLAGDGFAGALADDVLAADDSAWVKVAYSEGLRRAGELLNFFPGTYPGGIPNAPSPLASMLTSGILGAGLGYGAGRLARSVLPHGFGDNLDRTGMILGGVLGAAPGAVWGMTNRATGRGLNDPSLLAEPSEEYPSASMGNLAAPPGPPAAPEPDDHGHGLHLDHLDHLIRTPGPPARRYAKHAAAGLAVLPVAERLEDLLSRAREKLASAFGADRPRFAPTPMDVNVDALGRTLYDLNAPPRLAAATLGAMHAAQQFPDDRASPGWVTAGQLGQFAENASGNYLRGLVVGAALNTVVGTPLPATSYAGGALALGLIGAVVPKLFGG